MIQQQEIPLYNSFFYSYNINLAGTSYHLKFRYNSYIGCYFLDVYTYDKEPICLGMRLVPNFLLGTNLNHPDWKGGFYMHCVADIEEDYYITKPKQLSKYYRLLHCYDDEQE